MMVPILMTAVDVTPRPNENEIKLNLGFDNLTGGQAKFGVSITRDNLTGYINCPPAGVSGTYTFSPKSECNCMASKKTTDGKIIPLKRRQDCTCGFDGMLKVNLMINADGAYNEIDIFLYVKKNDDNSSDVIFDSSATCTNATSENCTAVTVKSSRDSGYRATIDNGKSIGFFMIDFSTSEAALDNIKYIFPHVIVKENIDPNSDIMADCALAIDGIIYGKDFVHGWTNIAEGLYSMSIAKMKRDVVSKSGWTEPDTINTAIRI